MIDLMFGNSWVKDAADSRQATETQQTHPGGCGDDDGFECPVLPRPLDALADVLFRKGLLRRSRGSFAAVIIYGGMMNPAAAQMYNSQSINLRMLKAYYVSGLPMDLIHAAATVIFIFLAAGPMLEKLDRIKDKYGLVE